jgi:hypothetical protein
MSAHEDKQHILLEVSNEECLSFAKQLLDFCEGKHSHTVVADEIKQQSKAEAAPPGGQL